MYFDKRFAVRKLNQFYEICGKVPLDFFLENYDSQPELIALCMQYRVRNPEDRECLLDYLTDDTQAELVRLARFDLLGPFLDDERFMRLVIGSICPGDDSLKGKIVMMCRNLESDYSELFRAREGERSRIAAHR
jgi:hypothetical protein